MNIHWKTIKNPTMAEKNLNKTLLANTGAVCNLYCSDKVRSAVCYILRRLDKMPLGNGICRLRRRHAASVTQ